MSAHSHQIATPDDGTVVGPGEICAVIVTYNPEESLENVLRSLQTQVGAVVLVDNASTHALHDRLADGIELSQFTLLENSANRGLAAALNQGIAHARTHGYSHALVLDQDSEPGGNMVQGLLRTWNLARQTTDVAVVGSNFSYRGSGRRLVDASVSGPSWRSVHSVMTSGTLVDLSVHAKVGGYREDFFVDLVDVEYCLRVRQYGYTVALTTDAYMVHAAGAPEAHQFLGRTVWTMNHSPRRAYDICRNHAVLLRSYGAVERAWATAASWSLLKWAVKALLFERSRAAMLAAISKGLTGGWFTGAPAERP